jgi:hypothetical protein
MTSTLYGQETQNIIDKINNRVSAIKTLTGDTESIGKRGAFTVSSTGKLYFQKPGYCRMINSAKIDGKLALDAGSNDNVFWVWSKHIKPVALNWCYHRDLPNIKMSEPLNITVLTEVLNVSKINTEGANIYWDKGFLIVLTRAQLAGGNKALKVTKIDPDKAAIVGHYAFGTNKKLISSCEIEDFNAGYIPKTCKIHWPAEGVSIKWTLSNVRLNTTINPAMFVMPDYKPKKNLAD